MPNPTPLNEGGGRAASKVYARMDDRMRQRVIEVADLLGVSVSDVLREAMKHYFSKVDAELDQLARTLGDGGDGIMSDPEPR